MDPNNWHRLFDEKRLILSPAYPPKSPSREMTQPPQQGIAERGLSAAWKAAKINKKLNLINLKRTGYLVQGN
ncbi:hypothetical protein DPMN_123869 [Dreissena polymorpha]|uniref:Uncharacterized protein n=1 Tax=Dreissena polymorpha TaxID=45954 RepID=A0A9D4GSE8_DREPO|nr:hypothetical protein DPMN_123869 [Dreissena polymorpha]